MKPSPCYACVHKIEIPGNCHIGCGNPDAKPKRQRWPGSGWYPMKYDPNTVMDCGGFSDKPEDRKEQAKNPMLDLLRLLS